jgi:hypothetical protein
MKSTTLLACVLLTWTICMSVSPAQADDCRIPCTNCKSWCPDDYQGKPLPKCPPTVCFGMCDDYQCKPLPKCPYVPKYIGCDDYRCKPLPKCPSHCFPSWYICGSMQAGTPCAQGACAGK